MTESDSPKPKFRRRAEDRPDEVLDAALTLFVQKGYGATSVAEIARAAGISKGAVYLYFPSKQAIIEGLVRRAVTPISARALEQAALAHGNLRTALPAVMRVIAEAMNDPKVYAVPRIVLHEAVVAPEIAAFYREAVLDMAIPAVEGLIAQGVARGELRPVDPEMTVRSLMGPIVIHVMLAEIFGVSPKGGLDLQRLIDNHIDILLNGLFAAPGGDNA